MNDYTYNDVESALFCLDSNDPRQEWVNNLCAVKNGLGEDGREMAERWSRQSEKFKEKDFVSTWNSISKDGPTTVKTLFHKAYQRGWTSPHKSESTLSTKKESGLSHSQQSQDEPPIFDEPPIESYKDLERTVNDFSKFSSHTPSQSTASVETTQNSTDDAAKNAAKRANVLKQWHSLPKYNHAKPHEYLVKKGLTDKLNGYEGNLRIGHDKNLGDYFAYPLINLETKEITGFNKVAKEGQDGKRLAWGSKKSGNAAPPIGNLDESTATVCISEGFANGVEVNYATKHTVLVANDAGNISNIAERVRKLYPQCKIVICPDNDDGGREGANKAVKALNQQNVVVAYPVNKDFSDDVLAGLNISESIQKVIDDNSTVVATAKEVTTKKKSDKSDKPSENMIALSIANRYKNRIANDIDACEWRSYKDGIWEVVKPAKVQQAIQETLNKEFGKDYKLTFVRGIFGLIASYVSHSKWDCYPDLVPFQNGVLNLKTKEFKPHDHKNYFTWQLPYAYNPAATCEPILTWLKEVSGSEQVVDLIRAFFNAALVGRAYLQRYLELIGPGGTGKGTVIRLLVQMLGNRNCYSTELKRLEDNRFETAAIYGKRLVMITDAEGYGGNANVLKALTGQDWLRKESKQKQQGDNYIFQGMVMMAANQTIVFKDLSSGISRRRIPVHFNRVVAPSEKRDLDKEFEPFIPGLLNWALAMPTDQVESLLRDTDNQVALSLDAKKQVLIEGNSIIAWLHACVEYAPGNRVKIGVLAVGKDLDGHEVDRFKDADKWLYPSYAKYCLQTGAKPTSSKAFSTRLLDVLNNILGLKSISHTANGYIDQTTRGAYFEGLKLSSNNEPIESIVDFSFLPKKKVVL